MESTVIDLVTLRGIDAWDRYCGWVERFGLGFHPDTRGRDYVNGDGAPSLTAREARQYDSDVEDAFAMGDFDPYEVGLTVMGA